MKKRKMTPNYKLYSGGLFVARCVNRQQIQKIIRENDLRGVELAYFDQKLSGSELALLLGEYHNRSLDWMNTHCEDKEEAKEEQKEVVLRNYRGPFRHGNVLWVSTGCCCMMYNEIDLTQTDCYMCVVIGGTNQYRVIGEQVPLPVDQYVMPVTL